MQLTTKIRHSNLGMFNNIMDTPTLEFSIRKTINPSCSPGVSFRRTQTEVPDFAAEEAEAL